MYMLLHYYLLHEAQRYHFICNAAFSIFPPRDPHSSTASLLNVRTVPTASSFSFWSKCSFATSLLLSLSTSLCKHLMANFLLASFSCTHLKYSSVDSLNTCDPLVTSDKRWTSMAYCSSTTITSNSSVASLILLEILGNDSSSSDDDQDNLLLTSSGDVVEKSLLFTDLMYIAQNTRAYHH